ncbi:MAG: hypothetical protein QHJ73_12165, partial [Armatimonadota bacterium]|nr:hypothetical protein [Armatimonadota bacterium]
LRVEATATANNTFSGNGAQARAFVGWSYQYNGNQPLNVVLECDYTCNLETPTVSVDDPMSSGGCAYVLLALQAKDLANPDRPVIKLERRVAAVTGAGIPLEGSNTFQPGLPLTLQPGHSYRFEAYLSAYTSAFLDKQTASTTEASSLLPKEASAHAKGSATVTRLWLQTLARPWVQTRIVRMFDNTHDTWYLYEQALRQLTGRDYFAAGAFVSVSAGGAYDPSQSSVRIEAPQSKIVEWRGCPLQVVRESDTAVRVELPNPYTLPLEGETWNFTLILDPDYQAVADRRFGLPVPLFGPVLNTLSSVCQAARRSARGQSAGRTALPAQELFNLANWYLLVPARCFSVDAGVPRGETPGVEVARPELLEAPSRSASVRWPAMRWSVVVPPGAMVPAVDLPGVNWAGVSLPTFAGEIPTWARREAGVMIRLGDLWERLTAVRPSANQPVSMSPEVKETLTRLYRFYQDKREYWSNLCFRAPNGTVYSLPQLPQLAVADPGSVSISIPRRDEIAPLAGPVIDPQSLHLPEFAWKSQPRSLLMSGTVRGQYTQASDGDRKDYQVYFDVVPRQQPWELVQPTHTQNVP